ncbi:hypothetical protein AG0111_0g1474 [Alternaria gaisen]|uniref:Uncharacterized protein n=1 Tax=Alternaria gaisen TaxID=167740 RepID=A0ACB6FZD9_9PLEO|nr:hypothetical protein AG0111_0g1474 [Alternaria gaisen]
MPGPGQLVFSSLLRTVTYSQDSSMNSNKASSNTSIAQDASFAFWFPLAWTLVGVLSSLFACLLAFFTTFRRRDPLTTRLDHILNVLRTLGESGGLRVVRDDVAELRKALTAQGQFLAETTQTLRPLMTDFQALATKVRETCQAVDGFMTEKREPATPVLLEILTELRKSNGDPRFQSWLRPVSFQVYLNAQAAVLARERKQANPSPFPELD